MTHLLKGAILLVFGVFSSYSYSQSKEYIVKTNGDTVFGETRLPIAFGKPKYKDFIMFTESGKAERKVTPKEIQSYVESGTLYLSLGKYGGGIFKPLSKGPLYIVDWYGSSAPSVSTSGYGMTAGRSSKCLALYRLGSEPVIINKLKFSKVMSDYFKDYSELAQKISNKELRYRNLSKIVELYNIYINK